MKNLSDKIAQFLGLPRSTQQYTLPHGSRGEHAVSLYYYAGQWRPDLCKENLGAVKACYARLGRQSWPLDYRDALAQLDAALSE